MLVSHAEEMNPGKRNTMEDVHRAILKFGGLPGMSFLAVYDGHGGRGIADYIETRLENNILNEMRSSVPQSDENAAPTPASGGKAVEEDICPTLKAMERAYLLTDMQSRQAGIMASGATAVTCLLDRTEGVGKIYTANCGDARAVLVKKDSVVRLSHDHKAEDPVEIDRIEASGGFVLRNRVLGILAVARSFGDHGMKEFVVCRPYLSETPLSEGDKAVVVACDGLWDVVSDEECKELLDEWVERDGVSKEGVAQYLIDEALKRGSTDNISVVVCWL
ncbi:hypothetical protein TrCOL_g1798 [Triparma columacea]|uniref:PPM-type phosphatase domain-containing protein n=1 Tax=Triparma columacea TaxID=722753 RepID=A0A9W7GIE4_9STRA|nr:hypothetical protein TrCOL_g1798 [Triparma columacea]